jgi:hypothetical protein
MHRLSDPIDVYAGGGCLDSARESAKFVRAPHSKMIKALDAMEVIQAS